MSWDAIDRLMGADQDVPDDAHTIAEWAEHFGLTYSAAEGRVRRLEQKGLLQSGCRCIHVGKKFIPVKHYWPCTSKPPDGS